MTADEYVRRVNYWLADLPWRTKQELLSELRGHLSELPEGTDLASLGPPEQYAVDLRAAAGLERRRGVIAFVRARRPRNLILTVVALTAIGLAIGAVAWIDSYQPLATGNLSVDPAGAKSSPFRDADSVVFHRGRRFQFGVSVLNTGRFTVRVRGVTLPPGLPFSARLMMSQPQKNRGGINEPFTRFHPFDLKPGQVSLLFFKGVFACRAPENPVGVLGVVDFPVRFSFLWRIATADLQLPTQLAIVFPKGVRCP